MNISKYLEGIALQTLGLVNAQSPAGEQPMVFVNDLEDVVMHKIDEYRDWYGADSDALLNRYRTNALIEYHTEPYYDANKRSYFWSRSSMESDYKRTHCSFARDMVDTIVSICGEPIVKVGKDVGNGNQVETGDLDYGTVLDDILKKNGFWSTYRKEQMPLTLALGWGGFKINWNPSVYGNVPIILYYPAQNVRVYKRGGFILGMTFLDWYDDGMGNRYLVAETRTQTALGKGSSRMDCFKSVSGNSGMDYQVCSLDEVPQLRGSGTEWEELPCMFAVPCSFYSDPIYGYPGRSVYEGKIDMLDDLDQAYSVMSNTIRRSTPVEVFDMDYVERDKNTKMPKMPTLFERRYVGVKGKKAADGSDKGNNPVVVTQPSLNIDMYNQHIDELKRAICGGHLSPATLGLDVAKKDNADAQREKEKLTIFTKNHLNKEESRILEELFEQVLIAYQYLNFGVVKTKEFGVSVEWDEFSNISFETRIGTMASVIANDAISPKTFVDRVYGKSMSDDDRQKEVEWLTEKHKEAVDSGEEDSFGEDEESFEEDVGTVQKEAVS